MSRKIFYLPMLLCGAVLALAAGRLCKKLSYDRLEYSAGGDSRASGR